MDLDRAGATYPDKGDLQRVRAQHRAPGWDVHPLHTPLCAPPALSVNPNVNDAFRNSSGTFSNSSVAPTQKFKRKGYIANRVLLLRLMILASTP